ncbi:MAG TPA: hypothetical protein DCL35_01070 [Candidatus Omnitrophica bacterium]|nr:hypothetical protein [Candidatus Omnitrophota bacterium]
MKLTKDTAVVSFLIVLIVFACLPLFKNVHNINLDLDFLQMLSSTKFDADATTEHYQIPLWSPYLGGGYPVYAHPSRRIGSPLFVIQLLFGEIIHVKVNIFLSFLIGGLGMYYLCRRIFKYVPAGALFSSLAFCLSGSLYAVTMMRGNIFLKDYFLMPLLLAFFIKSKDDRKYIYFTALALAFLSQGALKFAAIFLFLALFSCFWGPRVYLKNLSLICLWVVLLSAVKIIPTAGLLHHSGYRVDFYHLYGSGILTQAEFWQRVKGVMRIFLERGAPPLDISLKGYFPLYFYLGAAPLVLFAAAFFAEWKKQLRWAALLAVFLLLAFGTNTHLDIFRFLHKLPVFNSMYKPSKYFIPIITFIITLGAGSAFSLAGRFKRKRIAAAVFLLIGAAGIIDLYWANHPRRDIYPLPLPRYQPQADFFQVKNLEPSLPPPGIVKIPEQHGWELTFPTQYELLLQNIGKINAFTNIHVAEHAAPKYYVRWNGAHSLDPGNYSWIPNQSYRGEAYFLKSADNRAAFNYFSPNKFVLEVSLEQPDTLVINQNYDRYWRSDRGRLAPHKGLLSIPLAERGRYLVTLSYVPAPFYIGAGFTLFGFLLLAYYIFKEARR